MFYYQFNIADYASATAHLSNSEDLTYRRLLDLYYDQEKPLPTDTKWIARRIRVPLSDVETVLSEFFNLTELGYMHHRCEFELAKYHRRAETNKINGLKGGRKPSRNPVETQSEPNGLPIETQGQPSENRTLRQPNNQITKQPNNQEPNNQETNQEFITELSSTPVEKPESGVPFFQVAEVYNAVCVPFGRPKASVMNKKRKSAIARVWNGSAHAKSLDWWRSYFEAAMSIPYMSNGFTKQDGSQWGGADFDYLLQEKTIVKVVERSQ
jgi:uncharacterized protein YdaU (DUF1376 family)